MTGSNQHQELREDVEFIRQGPAHPGKPWHEFINFAETLPDDLGPMFGDHAARVGRYVRSLEEQLEAAQTPAWDRVAAQENKRLQEQLEAADIWRQNFETGARENQRLQEQLESIQQERDRLREALMWCNDHRDSERFHSVAESALNYAVTYPAGSPLADYYPPPEDIARAAELARERGWAEREYVEDMNRGLHPVSPPAPKRPVSPTRRRQGVIPFPATSSDSKKFRAASSPARSPEYVAPGVRPTPTKSGAAPEGNDGGTGAT